MSTFFVLLVTTRHVLIWLEQQLVNFIYVGHCLKMIDQPMLLQVLRGNPDDLHRVICREIISLDNETFYLSLSSLKIVERPSSVVLHVISPGPTCVTTQT